MQTFQHWVPIIPVGQQGDDEKGNKHGDGADVKEPVVRDFLHEDIGEGGKGDGEGDGNGRDEGGSVKAAKKPKQFRENSSDHTIDQHREQLNPVGQLESLVLSEVE